jgi:hypothetical protein
LPGATVTKLIIYVFCYYCSQLQHHTGTLCSHFMRYRSSILFLTNRDIHYAVIHPCMLVFCFSVHSLFTLIIC